MELTTPFEKELNTLPGTTPRMIRLGDAIITSINAGDMMVKIADEMVVPESELRHLYGSTLEGPRPFTSQSVHITLSDASILVDINDYTLAISLDPSLFTAQLFASSIRRRATAIPGYSRRKYHPSAYHPCALRSLN